MIARYTGACLGLLAFSVSVLAGLSAGNPLLSILSRAISALVVCCVIGAVIGAVAQVVVNEHIRHGEARMLAEREAEMASRTASEEADAGGQETLRQTA